jgi:hypothetical protein
MILLIIILIALAVGIMAWLVFGESRDDEDDRMHR